MAKRVVTDYEVRYTDGRASVSMADKTRASVWSGQAVLPMAIRTAVQSGGYVVGVYSDGAHRLVWGQGPVSGTSFDW